MEWQQSGNELGIFDVAEHWGYPASMIPEALRKAIAALAKLTPDEA